MKGDIRKVLVTGGAGFIGRHLIEGLVSEGYLVRCLDLYRPSVDDPNVDYICGSFLDMIDVEMAIDGCDAVFHLASTTIPKSSNDDPLFDINTNLLGSVNLLNKSISAGVKKFIFISSGGTVYGSPKILPVSELHDTFPLCSYGIVKLSIEKYMYMYSQLHGLDTCVLRLSNPYGEYQRPDTGQGVIAAFCHNAVLGKPINIWGNGTVIRDYIYIKDAVSAMLISLTHSCAGCVLNVGSGERASLIDVITHIELALGYKIEDITFGAGRIFDVPEIYLDVSKAKDILGWEPKSSLGEGIKLLVDSLRGNLG